MGCLTGAADSAESASALASSIVLGLCEEVKEKERYEVSPDSMFAKPHALALTRCDHVM